MNVVRISTLWCGMSMGILCAWAGPIDQGQRSDRLEDGIGGAGTSSGVDEEPAPSTAEDVLRALQKRRPLNVVIPPGSVREGGGQSLRTALYPEGWAFVSRSGRPLYRDNRWFFLLDGADDESPVGLLPNAIVEGMVRSSAGAPSTLHFVVSGELTVFQGENYLLPRLAMRASAPTVPPAAPHGPRGPATPAPAGSADAEASAEEVLAMLHGQLPSQQVVSVGDTSSGRHDSKGAAIARTLLPDGAPLVDRPGRLVDEGQWWTFVFESDNPDYPELPMKLLRNQNVELMVEASRRGELGLVFVVSGEVTVFNGENYLLPRTVMRRIDSGNLTK